jgi:serine protease Do
VRAGAGLILLLAAGLGSAHADPERAALVQAGASVLKVEALRPQGGYSLGSAVVVAPERAVTNCHVTRDSSQIHLRRGELRLRVGAIAADAAHDLCLLHVPGLKAAVATLGSSAALQRRQSVTALGYTGGLGIQSSAGKVVALHRMDGGRVVQSTNWFTSGASGGGLFDDALQLVGVLTFRLRGGEVHYFAAPVEWVRPLLAAPAQPVAPLPPDALAYWQLPAPRQPAFLQAVALERDGKWAELEALALRWGEADAADGAAAATQALALEGLNRLADAQAAWERAVTLDPGATHAWYRLAQIYTRQGAGGRADAALARLQTLDPEAARDLRAQLARP